MNSTRFDTDLFIADNISLAWPAASLDGADSPDAALPRAFEDWLDANRGVGQGVGETDEADRPFYDRIDDSQDRMHAIPARPPQGIAAKLRWLWMTYGESQEYYDVVLNGAPVPDDLLLDGRDKMLWNLVGQVEGMNAQIAAPPQPSAADARLVQQEKEYRGLYNDKEAVNGEIARLTEALSLEARHQRRRLQRGHMPRNIGTRGGKSAARRTYPLAGRLARNSSRRSKPMMLRSKSPLFGSNLLQQSAE
jgi:hypothetical protein